MEITTRKLSNEARAGIEFIYGLAVGLVADRREHLRGDVRDRGDILQTVVTIGLFVVGAIAVGGIIISRARSQAESISVP